jgi:hypothetical protein
MAIVFKSILFGALATAVVVQLFTIATHLYSRKYLGAPSSKIISVSFSSSVCWQIAGLFLLATLLSYLILRLRFS